MNVTACLITWKRQKNIPKIVENLLGCNYIDEILIRDNSKCKNLISYGRYPLIKKAKNDLVYVQDDDYNILNIDDIYEAFQKDPNKIANGAINDYLESSKNNIYGSTQMGMVGFGTIFNKNWINVLDKYIEKYGKDYCLLREADRIFTMLYNKHLNLVKVDVDVLWGERESIALSSQKDHLDFKALAIKRCREILGI